MNSYYIESTPECFRLLGSGPAVVDAEPGCKDDVEQRNGQFHHCTANFDGPVEPLRCRTACGLLPVDDTLGGRQKFSSMYVPPHGATSHPSMATSYDDDAYVRHHNRYDSNVAALYDNVDVYHRSPVDSCNRSNYGVTSSLVPLTVDCGATDSGDLPSSLSFSRNMHGTCGGRFENPSICRTMASPETTQLCAASYSRWSSTDAEMMQNCAAKRSRVQTPCESNNSVSDVVSSSESIRQVTSDADSNNISNVVYPWMRRVHLTNGRLIYIYFTPRYAIIKCVHS
jgi:hypothetical protein